MEYSFEFDPTHNALICRVSGAISLQEVKQSVRDRYDHPEYRPGVNLVIDLSDTSSDTLVDFDLAEYRRFTRQVRQEHGDRNPSYMIAPANLSFGLSRMVQQTSEALDDAEIHVFRTIDQAFARMKELSQS